MLTKEIYHTTDTGTILHFSIVIKGELWEPETWSVFGQAVRTNNDVEGWYGMLKRHARRGNLSLYLMVRLLHEQAQLVHMQVCLVSKDKVKRRQRKLYR